MEDPHIRTKYNVDFTYFIEFPKSNCFLGSALERGSAKRRSFLIYNTGEAYIKERKRWRKIRPDDFFRVLDMVRHALWNGAPHAQSNCVGYSKDGLCKASSN